MRGVNFAEYTGEFPWNVRLSLTVQVSFVHSSSNEDILPDLLCAKYLIRSLL